MEAETQDSSYKQELGYNSIRILYMLDDIFKWYTEMYYAPFHGVHGICLSKSNKTTFLSLKYRYQKEVLFATAKETALSPEKQQSWT